MFCRFYPKIFSDSGCLDNVDKYGDWFTYDVQQITNILLILMVCESCRFFLLFYIFCRFIYFVGFTQRFSMTVGVGTM